MRMIIRKTLNYLKVSLRRKTFMRLQFIEAGIVSDKVGTKLMREKISFLTIHDQILVNNERDLEIIKRIVKQVFEDEYGVSPKLKRKNFE